jgi:hypothetical protein
MLQNEICEREQKSAAASYRNIPMWMRRIEQKMRRSKTKQDIASGKKCGVIENFEAVNEGQ